jgi:hypothetical protein
MAITYPDSEPRYVGAVLDTREENLAHDSYFHAIVWDGEKVTSVETHSTAYGGPWPAITLDATADVLDAALAWYRKQWLAAAIKTADRIAREITVGKTVRSTTTRGKNVGVVGVVKRAIVNGFSSRDDAMRIQVELPSGELRWMDDNRLEVVDPEPANVDALTEQSRYVEPSSWRNAQPMVAEALARVR